MTITINRLSDGSSITIDEVTPATKVKVLKQLIMASHPPAHPRGKHTF